MSAQIQTEERRRSKRFSVRLKVYLQETDELLGYAENLNHGGMMLVTRVPLKKQQELRIWFGAKKEDNQTKRIIVSAYKVWEAFNTSKEHLYYSGMHFVAPSEETQDRIISLIEQVAV